MSGHKMKDIRNMNEGQIVQRIQELRVELSKLYTSSAKGTLRKDSGKIRPVRRGIARLMTRLGELEREEEKE